MKRSKNKKGFTLIELLAVIIILGVLLLIAIPSVTSYISTSRKKTYIATADKYIGAVVNKVNALDYNITETDTMYYVPVSLIELERGGRSPYGEWTEAYVVVTFDGDSYKYYWTSVDDSGMGIELTLSKELSIDKIQGGMTTVNKGMVRVEGKTYYVEVKSDNSITAKKPIEETTGEIYTVTFDCNEVECIVTPTEKEVENGSTYGEIPEPTRVGYTFLGWYTEKEEGEWIKIFTTVELTENQTLYAHWQPINYTIQFEGNGGNGATASKACTYGIDCQLTTNSFIRTGYTFLGWSTNSGASSATYTNEQNVNNLTAIDGSTVTIYAIWQANTHIVSYNCNGISCTLGTKTVTYGSTYGTLAIPPTRTGYTFEGWYTLASGGSKIESTTNVTITSNQTLYAQWKVVLPKLADVVSIGDYVNYNAGTWSETKSKPTNSTPFTFGGYTSGSTRNSSVTCESKWGSPSSSGWRVLSKNTSTGEVKLIHAGQPECYYHPNITDSRGNSEKILIGSTSYAINGSYTSTPRDWSMYVNSAYAVSATAFTKLMLDGWNGSTVTYSTTITNDLIKTNAYYWLGAANPSYTYYLDCVGHSGIVSYSGGGDDGFGVRPVVTLKPNILTTGQGTDSFGNTAWILQ